jgi:hypothetical protein
MSCSFFVFHIVSIVSCIVPQECWLSKMCWAYLEVDLLDFMAFICSLYLVLNVRPVWPIYFWLHSLHVSW